MIYRFNVIHFKISASVQFSSVTQLCPTLCDPMNRSTPGLPVHHQLPESTQTHVHWACQCQVYRKVIQSYINIYPLFFRLFSHIGHYRILGRAPWTIQVLVSILYTHASLFISFLHYSPLPSPLSPSSSPLFLSSLMLQSLLFVSPLSGDHQLPIVQESVFVLFQKSLLLWLTLAKPFLSLAPWKGRLPCKMSIKEKSTEADTVDCSANGYSIPFFLSGTYWFSFFLTFRKRHILQRGQDQRRSTFGSKPIRG